MKYATRNLLITKFWESNVFLLQFYMSWKVLTSRNLSATSNMHPPLVIAPCMGVIALCTTVIAPCTTEIAPCIAVIAPCMTDCTMNDCDCTMHDYDANFTIGNFLATST